MLGAAGVIGEVIDGEVSNGEVLETGVGQSDTTCSGVHGFVPRDSDNAEDKHLKLAEAAKRPRKGFEIKRRLRTARQV